MSPHAKNVILPKLSLTAYETRANASNQFLQAPDAINQLRYGFFGEVGGLLSAVKKSRRELGAKERDTVMEELGDAFWYFATIVRQYHLQLETVGEATLLDLQQRLSVLDYQSATKPLTFYEFDELIDFCHGKFLESKDRLLCNLAAHTGEVVAHDASQGSHLGAHPPNKLLSQILADMMMVAAIFNLKIEHVAESNLKKIESRWPPAGAKHIDLFDMHLQPYEQLPRKMTVHFIERELNGKKFVVQQLNGVNIGDRLTDNRIEPDGYRFHDVFHLAYVAHLGWSPVLRGLLRYKRKSDPIKDENEDGARAMIIEEGIATWIFNHAFQRDYYAGVTKGKLEYGLLKQVQDMVKGYEVQSCPLWQWELAILDGFNVFRQLRDSGGGFVHVDLKQRTIRFESSSSP
ncbi:MAG: nucleoside triphosphate pyrophosphohydrolase family protein [Ferrovum sp.]|nr:nucleoside triphosphate pyrophosphohydrolase family protein [Ferrovum sp.]